MMSCDHSQAQESKSSQDNKISPQTSNSHQVQNSGKFSNRHPSFQITNFQSNRTPRRGTYDANIIHGDEPINETNEDNDSGIHTKSKTVLATDCCIPRTKLNNDFKTIDLSNHMSSSNNNNSELPFSENERSNKINVTLKSQKGSTEPSSPMKIHTNSDHSYRNTEDLTPNKIEKVHLSHVSNESISKCSTVLAGEVNTQAATHKNNYDLLNNKVINPTSNKEETNSVMLSISHKNNNIDISTNTSFQNLQITSHDPNLKAITSNTARLQRGRRYSRSLSYYLN